MLYTALLLCGVDCNQSVTEEECQPFLQAKLDELLSKKRDIQSNKEAVDDENRKKASNILSNGLAVVFENR